MSLQQFNYDQQIRRVIIQLMRMFSNIQIEYGFDVNNNPIFLRLPVMYGDSSRQVQNIIANNTQNTMNKCPTFSLHIADLKYDRARLQAPQLTQNVNIRTRTPDPNNPGNFLPQQNNAYTIGRIMPAPYKLTIKLDLWTTNSNQKLQALEQLLPQFNPSLEIQFDDEYIDWTSLSAITLTDIQWSSRNIPVGADDAIDIATMTFEIPIWLSMPAQVTKLGQIIKVITSLYNSNTPELLNDFVNETDLLLGTRSVVTFNNYNIFVNNSNVQILPQGTVPQGATLTTIGNIALDNELPWPGIIEAYGNILPGVSELRLNLNNNVYPPQQIYGTISINSTANTILNFDITTSSLPGSTLTAIDSIIDPQTVAPGINNLPIAAINQRYLLTNGTNNSPGWTTTSSLIANENDIIEYNGTNWFVSFDAINTANIQYCDNLDTGIQLKWNGTEWLVSWGGLYTPDEWSIVI